MLRLVLSIFAVKMNTGKWLWKISKVQERKESKKNTTLRNIVFHFRTGTKDSKFDCKNVQKGISIRKIWF